MSAKNLETEYENAHDSPGFLLWQLTNAWQSEQRKALAPFDLTHVQFVLLAVLVSTNNTGSVSQKELSMLAKTDIMMTSQVVRTLEKKGLVTRQKNASDKRAVQLQPTQKGTALASKAVQIVERVDKAFFKNLGADLPKFTHMMQLLT